MIYLQLYMAFFKAGLFSFGGAYGSIPLIRDVVLSYGWLSDEELTYMIAVSESTPGSLMVNMATFVGSSQAGILGAAAATLAVITPAFVVMLLVVAALKSALKNRFVQAVIDGLTPCIIGIILAIGMYMTVTRITGEGSEGGINVMTLVVTLILAALMFGSKKFMKKQLSPITLIVISAVLGIILL